MLSEKIIDKLKSNWGARGDSLACNVEVRIYDSIEPWECYLLAINPQDEDIAKAFIINDDNTLHTDIISLSHLLSRWNGEGEFMQIDNSFVPRLSSELYKILKERHP